MSPRAQCRAAAKRQCAKSIPICGIGTPPFGKYSSTLVSPRAQRLQRLIVAYKITNPCGKYVRRPPVFLDVSRSFDDSEVKARVPLRLIFIPTMIQFKFKTL
jgi:hypothetical protein